MQLFNTVIATVFDRFLMQNIPLPSIKLYKIGNEMKLKEQCVKLQQS